MSNTYTLTVSESSTGRFLVTNVEKTMRINQHRTDSMRLANSTFAFAPASHLFDQGQLIPTLGAGTEGLSGLALMIMYSAARESGVDPSTLVTPAIAAKLKLIEEGCPLQLAQSLGTVQPKDLLKPGVTTASIDAALKAMNPNVKIKVPVLILQGLGDSTVFPFYTQALVNELKTSGGKVTYNTFAGLSHSGVVTDAAVKNAVSAWIKARLR